MDIDSKDCLALYKIQIPMDPLTEPRGDD